MLGYNPTMSAVLALSGIERMFFVENDLSLVCRSYHFSLWASHETLRIQILNQFKITGFPVFSIRLCIFNKRYNLLRLELF